MKKKILAATLALSMAIATMGTAMSVYAADATESGTLKLVLSTNDGSTTDDRVPTPWMNHNLATSLMFRNLLIADSSLQETSPDLAESVEVSDDGLTYTITMKDGVKWSDGEDITVDDVIWSINMVQEAARKNSIYSAAFGNITDLTADGNVITMKLGTPYAQMKDILAQFSILPKHCLEKEDGESIDSCSYWTAPVTSGYYTVGEFNTGNYFTLVPNTYYEGTAPKIQNVQFLLYRIS